MMFINRLHRFENNMKQSFGFAFIQSFICWCLFGNLSIYGITEYLCICTHTHFWCGCDLKSEWAHVFRPGLAYERILLKVTAPLCGDVQVKIVWLCVPCFMSTRRLALSCVSFWADARLERHRSLRGEMTSLDYRVIISDKGQAWKTFVLWHPPDGSEVWLDIKSSEKGRKGMSFFCFLFTYESNTWTHLL